MGSTRVISSVYSSNALIPTWLLSVISPLLNASAFTTPYNVSTNADPVLGSINLLKEYSKSAAVTGSPLDHYDSLKWNVYARPSFEISHVSAIPGIILLS